MATSFVTDAPSKWNTPLSSGKKFVRSFFRIACIRLPRDLSSAAVPVRFFSVPVSSFVHKLTKVAVFKVNDFNETSCIMSVSHAPHEFTDTRFSHGNIVLKGPLVLQP